MKRQTVLYKYKYYFIKNVKFLAEHLKPMTIRARLKGPIVLINSIPKSGTHLVERALEGFPLLINSARPTFMSWNAVTEKTIKDLSSMKKGLIYTAHYPYYPQIVDLVKQLNIKLVFVIRDPRDIVVSRSNYSTKIAVHHKSHKYFASLQGEYERIMTSIVGEAAVISPINEPLKIFSGWLNDPSCFTIRFEDIIGSQGGGSDQVQLNTIKQLSDYLGFTFDDQLISNIAANTYSTKSLTFSTGSIDKWRNYFHPDHTKKFNEIAGMYLQMYGYS